MDDQGHALAHIQSLEQGVEVTAMLNEPIRARAAVGQLVGVTHADQVGAMQRPSGCRCGMTLRQRYEEVGLPCSSTIGSPSPNLHVSHLAAEDPPPLLFVGKCR